MKRKIRRMTSMTMRVTEEVILPEIEQMVSHTMISFFLIISLPISMFSSYMSFLVYGQAEPANW